MIRNKLEYMTKKDYTKLNKEELLEVIKNLESKKKYGLVWDEEKVPEKVVVDCQHQLPVLKEVKDKEIITDQNQPTHILIEGDNYHALSVLNYTHKGKIDLIYIDPPYNTGKANEWKYNDKYVDENDTYSHSKWASFMFKRLSLAKDLLKDTGVILISIDDNEQAHLKLICDDIFGSNNFVANMIWRGGKRNAAKFISTSHEYIMFYGKSLETISKLKINWKVKKSGLDVIYKQYDKLKKIHKNDYAVMTTELKRWFKELAPDNPAKDHEHYCCVDKQGIYFASDISRGGGGGPKWQIKNPTTGEIVNTPARGWAFSKEEELLNAIKDDKIHFSGSSVPCFKRYLKENESAILDTIFYKDRRAASIKFRDIMGDGIFDFPKDPEVIQYFIDALSPDDAIVLDFFAGSGTTGHSVLELNKNGSNRKFILATNNEGSICTEVTQPRLDKAIKGYTGIKTNTNYQGLGGNLKYFKTSFVKNRPNKDQLKIEITKQCTEMLCLKEGIFNLKTATKDYKIFEQDNSFMAVFYDFANASLDDLKKQMNALKGEKILYCFTLLEKLETINFKGWKDIRLEPIPQKILDIYLEIFKN
jgi:adenine-specific DNA-methyltransferase